MHIDISYEVYYVKYIVTNQRVSKRVSSLLFTSDWERVQDRLMRIDNIKEDQVTTWMIDRMK